MLNIKNITKTYTSKKGNIKTHVLKGIDIDIEKGEFIGIMGKSGSGKSTLLYQISALDIPTTGEVLLDGIDLVTMSDTERTRTRLETFGYVFQNYALMPDLTAIENVMVPMMMLGMSRAESYQKAQEALDRIGLGHRLDNRPYGLSGGEQQRVSIARAVAQNPRILFADEPTANLDGGSSNNVIDIMRGLHNDGQTIVMVTHEPEYTEHCTRVLHLADGIIERDVKK